MDKVIIVKPKEFNKKIARFKEGRADKLHILSDFDKTLTTFILPNGEKMPSLISRIRNGDYLSKEYSKKANELYDYYHPIEIDLKIPLEEKKRKMYEWWNKHFTLLGQAGLTKKVAENVAQDLIKNERVDLRLGVKEFINTLNKKNIPLIILSSSIGDLIKLYMEKEGLLKNNVHVIANTLKYDKNGRFAGVEHIVHVFNKDETVLEDFPEVFEKIRDRKNAILLGDSLGDLGMIEGFNYDNLIKIGFLNENIEENIKIYKEQFDVIILNDGTMDYINNLLREIIS